MFSRISLVAFFVSFILFSFDKMTTPPPLSSILTDTEAEVLTRLASGERSVWRNGQTLVNGAEILLASKEDDLDLENKVQVASIMARIYTAPLESQQSLAQSLFKENPGLQMYMWFEAASTCHAEIRKAFKESGQTTLSSLSSSGDPYWKKRRDEVFESPPEKRFEAVEAWTTEFEGEGTELLFGACVKGDPVVLKYLLDSGVQPLSETDPTIEPLHAACYNGNLECAKLLHGAGIDINHKGEHEGTPLMRAAVAGNADIAKWLLENGADATAQETGEGNYNALEYGAGKSADLTRMLLDRGSTFTPMALAAAAHHGNVQSFDHLFAAGGYHLGATKDDVVTNEGRNQLLQALSMSGWGGSLYIIDALLDYMVSRDGNEPQVLLGPVPELKQALQDAAKGAVAKNHREAADTILSLISRLRDQQYHELMNSLLALSAASGSPSTARLLLDSYEADINYLSKPHMASPLYLAVREGRTSLIRLFVEEYGANMHTASGKFANGPTPLWLAIDQQNEPIVRELLQLGGPVEYIDPEVASSTKRIYISAGRHYRAPVKILTLMDSAWDVQGSEERFLCLEYPDGFQEELKMRRTDDELKDERELRPSP